ncbi:hypothetical protein BJV82DRAFT_525080, partial [Fennellomyces sp. T-0311]
AVGVFHAYAHSASCQVEYNPKYARSFGMTDGEWSERLWSYMNGHIRTTRHMSHDHRLLVLTRALDAFKEKRIYSIGTSLCLVEVSSLLTQCHCVYRRYIVQFIC